MTVASHKIGFRSGRRAEAETPPASSGPWPPLPRFALVADAAESLPPEEDGQERVSTPAEAEEASESTGTLGEPQEAPEGLTEAVVDLPAPARGGRSRKLAAAMKAMTEMFSLALLEDDEPTPQQQLHVHFAPQPVHVDVAAPPQAPAAPAPDVHVTVEPAKIEMPDVHVTFEAPVAPAAPAPTVVVRNEVPVPEVRVDVQPTPVEVAAPNVQVDVEVPRPGPIRVETEADGSRVYIPEEA